MSVSCLRKWIKGIIPLFFIVCGGSQASEYPLNNPDTLKNAVSYTSWKGVEPDKWATVWLIKRYISPNSYFQFITPNNTLPQNAILFGVPDAAIKRANRQSMFRRLKKAMNINSIDTNYIDQIVHDIEVNIWDKSSHKHSIWFETLFRKLQSRYERDKVPLDCYMAFFDGVAELSIDNDVTAEEYQKKINLESLCPGLKETNNKYVESINHLEILREISRGAKVVFIDTREDDEFNEVHLPGSKLLRLREVNEKSVKALENADLVVPYCIKDFRGFEVAKSIKGHGITRVATLSPNGLKGWLAAKLPVARPGEIAEKTAIEALMRCAADPYSCINRKGT